jgi:phosphoribosyl-AMP cyclohydrolase
MENPDYDIDGLAEIQEFAHGLTPECAKSITELIRNHLLPGAPASDTIDTRLLRHPDTDQWAAKSSKEIEDGEESESDNAMDLGILRDGSMSSECRKVAKELEAWTQKMKEIMMFLWIWIGKEKKLQRALSQRMIQWSPTKVMTWKKGAPGGHYSQSWNEKHSCQYTLLLLYLLH